MGKKILFLVVAFAVAASAGDYSSLDDANKLIGETQGTMTAVIGFAGFIFGWILTVGFALGGYYFGYKHFKEKDEQDRSGSTNTAMIHAKSAGISLVALIAGTLVFTFLFVKTLHVGGKDADTATAIAKVLKVDKAFE